MMKKNDILDALAYIGVDPKDFDLKDNYFTSTYFAYHRKHGMGHIYRVMLGTAFLAKELKEPRLGKLAFCAAFLHDQNRLTQGGDRNHGLRAAQNNFNMFTSLWDKYELSPIERDYVRAACADHSDNDGHNFRKNYEITNIVKDADALDRCRFYQHGRLNPNYLKFQKESRKLIEVTEEICAPTNVAFSHAVSFLDFIDMASNSIAVPMAINSTYNREFAPDIIKSLEPGQIFVFNNNKSGDSRLRTAVGARRYHGAHLGVAEGLTGATYSIPTDGTLSDIADSVKRLIQFARVNPDFEFLLTKIGCGQAGFTPAQIAPLFKDAISVQNILLPKEFVDEIIK